MVALEDRFLQRDSSTSYTNGCSVLDLLSHGRETRMRDDRRLSKEAASNAAPLLQLEAAPKHRRLRRRCGRLGQRADRSSDATVWSHWRTGSFKGIRPPPTQTAVLNLLSHGRETRKCGSIRRAPCSCRRGNGFVCVRLERLSRKLARSASHPLIVSFGFVPQRDQ